MPPKWGKLSAMQITYRRLSEFLMACAAWQAPDAKHPTSEKIDYAVKKLQKVGRKLFDAYAQAQEDIQIEHAEEKDGILVRDAKEQLQYSKAGLMARNKALRALVEQTVDLPAFKVKAEHVPADLGADYRDAFEGLILPASSDLELVEREA
jgi:hypothetical protein